MLSKYLCEEFAKDVYLSTDEIEGFFSDNYFDLIPGVAKRITFQPKNKIDGIEGKIKVISLFDSY